MSDLPPNARHYVDAVERLSGASICLVSVGPERHQTIERKDRLLRHRPQVAAAVTAFGASATAPSGHPVAE